MRSDDSHITFVSLLHRRSDAQHLARVIDGFLRADPADAGGALVPERRGAAFFAAGDAGGGARTVYLVVNEEGLAEAARHTPGTFFVAHAPTSTALLDPRWRAVRAAPQDAVLALGEAVLREYGAVAGTGDPPVFDSRAAGLLAALRLRPTGSSPAVSGTDSEAAGIAIPSRRRPGTPRARPNLPPLLTALDDGDPTCAPDPFDLLIDASGRRPQVTEPPIRATGAPPRTSSAGARFRASFPPRRGRGDGDDRLAARLVERAPMIVAVGSRKGGVGKTSHAAGMAIVAGTVLDSVGHRAAILDANIANPDSWGHLQLPALATTVRSLAAALAAGLPPPRPVNARTPALACYPETREGADYARTDVRRLAAHLRARFAFVIVDLSNRLPDPTAGPEAATAAFWLDEADALVLPTACSRQDFIAVLDYLDVGGLPPVMVPCLVPSARRNRRHPAIRHYLAEIGARVERIVEVPDDADRVRLAGMDGVAVQELSAPLRHAYRDLTDAVSRLPARRR